MRIKNATEQYEAWLGKQTRLLPADLVLKHQAMAGGVFPFLRATFYRWMELWPEICPQAVNAPVVLAVGDLHVENFGTWRDAEGRLVWGVNDFDEAHPLPYTGDLIRLASSAHLAIDENHLAMKVEDACQSILSGYRESLEAGGRPYVLEERHGWLRNVAMNELRDPVRFWEKMDGLPTLRSPVPASARKALESLLPEAGLAYRVAHRVAGLGSLGRERYVALAEWRGGKVAREAKALVPSACRWARGATGPAATHYEEIMTRAVRILDPFVHVRGKWIVRRLAPHCLRIELTALPKERDEARMLHAMGWETANVHLGSKQAVAAVLADLKQRPAHWLHDAGKEMVKAATNDWKDWKSS